MESEKVDSAAAKEGVDSEVATVEVDSAEKAAEGVDSEVKVVVEME